MSPSPLHRLVLAVVPGMRTRGNAEAIVAEVKQRLGDRVPDLITSDEAPAYERTIGNAFSEPEATVNAPRVAGATCEWLPVIALPRTRG